MPDVVDALRETGPTKFKTWRERQGWSLEECAGLTGFSKSHIAYIESHPTAIRDPRTRVRIARCLGCKVSDLFEPLSDPVTAA
jgi:transcriptional regulator with XRE-family HTH domain